jgi:undecaprenyl-phosphate galactose phosphotransferase
MALFLSDAASFATSALVAQRACAAMFTTPTLPGFAEGVSWGSGTAMLFFGLAIYLSSLGRYTQRNPFWSEFRSMIATTLVVSTMLVTMSLLFGIFHQAVVVLLSLLLFPVLATMFSQTTKQLLTLAGVWTVNVVIIGNGQSAADLEKALGSDMSLGFQVVQRVDPTVVMGQASGSKLRSLLDSLHATRLMIAMDGESDIQRSVIQAALRERVPFSITPPPHALPAFTHAAQGFLSHDVLMMSFRDGLRHPFTRTAKAVFDVSVATILLILGAPLMLLIAGIIRLDGGPALFAHRRVGAGGRSFPCMKFRTMVVNGEAVLADVLANDPVRAAEWAATQKLTDDPRITRVGAFLRATSLDELPQLFNVLRLEMSLVGPRPIVQSEVAFYGPNIAQYYATRPGLTGLWQVSGRSDTTYEQRVHLDVWYVNNWSFWNDVAVLMKTIPAVMSRAGAR